ncbi:hypothetical protein [Ralstonia phage RSP15]|uniref:hypothetical protein n=1 Tax=Ralstonia phage RSP15 TaxID=1785960 RepID=UPI00074D48C4|nr:hypothetical protein BH754_gp015 [Ralstonia phage RSP15]BAU39973.1 hypothetical protein [Ralstonia phage RSP15]
MPINTPEEIAAAYRILTLHLRSHITPDGGFVIPAKSAKIFRDAAGISLPELYEDRSGPLLPNIVKANLEARNARKD